MLAKIDEVEIFAGGEKSEGRAYSKIYQKEKRKGNGDVNRQL